jgi:hypothetical protein
MMAAAADLIVLDTLGKLRAHSHGFSTYCRLAGASSADGTHGVWPSAGRRTASE